MQREKPGPSLGLLGSSRSGFLVGSLPSAKLPGRPLWCPVTQQPTTKTPLQGILGERQRTRRKWGMGTELSESRVWPRPYFQAIKAPSFPQDLHACPDTKGPRRKDRKWRARPLDHTGNECLLPFVWRLRNVPQAGGRIPRGLRGSPHPAGTRWVDGRTRVTQVTQGLWTLTTPLSGEVKAEMVKSGHLLHRILIKKRLHPKAKGVLNS